MYNGFNMHQCPEHPTANLLLNNRRKPDRNTIDTDSTYTDSSYISSELLA